MYLPAITLFARLHGAGSTLAIVGAWLVVRTAGLRLLSRRISGAGNNREQDTESS